MSELEKIIAQRNEMGKLMIEQATTIQLFMQLVDKREAQIKDYEEALEKLSAIWLAHGCEVDTNSCPICKIERSVKSGEVLEKYK